MRIIDNWYAATERALERRRRDPEFLRMIRERSGAIAQKAKRSA
jgi:hypothetical protein